MEKRLERCASKHSWRFILEKGKALRWWANRSCFNFFSEKNVLGTSMRAAVMVRLLLSVAQGALWDPRLPLQLQEPRPAWASRSISRPWQRSAYALGCFGLFPGTLGVRAGPGQGQEGNVSDSFFLWGKGAGGVEGRGEGSHKQFLL